MQSSACLSGLTIQHREEPFIHAGLPNPPSKLPSNSLLPEWTRWQPTPLLLFYISLCLFCTASSSSSFCPSSSPQATSVQTIPFSFFSSSLESLATFDLLHHLVLLFTFSVACCSTLKCTIHFVQWKTFFQFSILLQHHSMTCSVFGGSVERANPEGALSPACYADMTIIG